MTVRRYWSQRVQRTVPYPAVITAVQEIVPNLPRCSIVHGDDATVLTEWALVEADVSDAEATALAADARITVLPFNAAGSVPIDLDAPISTMTAANRTAITTRLENAGIPISNWVTTLQVTPRQILRFLIRRLLLRAALKADDWNEGLDTLVSDIPQDKKLRARDKLLALGLTPSVIEPTDTVREAIRKVAEQNVPNLKTHLD